MKDRALILITSIIVCIVVASVALGQQRGVADADRANITSMVNGLFGPIYNVTNVVNIDSSLHPGIDAGVGFSDPYGTLQHCLVFVATGRRTDQPNCPKGFIGVVRGGQLLWLSDTLMEDFYAVSAMITGVSDLNRDGVVDIIASTFEGVKMNFERLWIFSWDGKTGHFISETDSVGASTLCSSARAFRFVDLQGNGVKTIVGLRHTGQIPDQVEQVIYSWNGIHYGLSRNSTLPKGELPRNRLTVHISSIAKSRPVGYQYRYYLLNDVSSLQSVNEFLVEATIDSIISSQNPKHWDFTKVLNGHLFDWEADMLFKRYIDPGMQDSAFSAVSPFPPHIAKCYFRGFNPVVDPRVQEPFSLDEWKSNVRDNSASGFTVAPETPPTTHGSVGFADSLNSYLLQSRTLGWFTNRPDTSKPLAGELATDSIMTRLTKRLTRVRNALVANDSATARTELTRFINKVQSLYKETNDGDQAPGEIVLTSEAYALLKFNAQFLLAKIAQ